MAVSVSPRAIPSRISSRSITLRRPKAGAQSSGSPGRFWPRRILTTPGGVQPSSRAIWRSVMPLALSRRAICFCSRVMCAAIWALLGSDNEALSMDRVGAHTG